MQLVVEKVQLVVEKVSDIRSELACCLNSWYPQTGTGDCVWGITAFHTLSQQRSDIVSHNNVNSLRLHPALMKVIC